MSVVNAQAAQDSCKNRVMQMLDAIKSDVQRLVIVYPTGSGSVFINLVDTEHWTGDPTSSIPLDTAAAVCEAETLCGMPFTQFLFTTLRDEAGGMGLNNLATVCPSFLTPHGGERKVKANDFCSHVIAQATWALTYKDGNGDRAQKLLAIWNTVSVKLFKKEINPDARAHVPGSHGSLIHGLRNFEATVIRYLNATYASGGGQDPTAKEHIDKLCNLSHAAKKYFQEMEKKYKNLENAFEMARNGTTVENIEKILRLQPDTFLSWLASISTNTLNEFVKILGRSIAQQGRDPPPSSASKQEPGFIIRSTAFWRILDTVTRKEEPGSATADPYRKWQAPQALYDIGQNAGFKASEQLRDLMKLRFDRELVPIDFLPLERQTVKLEQYRAFESELQTALKKFNITEASWNNYTSSFDHNMNKVLTETIVHGKEVPGDDRKVKHTFAAFFSHVIGKVQCGGGVIDRHHSAVTPDYAGVQYTDDEEPAFSLAVCILQSLYTVISKSYDQGMSFLGLVDFRKKEWRDHVLGMLRTELDSKCKFLDSTPQNVENFWHDALYTTIFALKSTVAKRQDYNAMCSLPDDYPSYIQIVVNGGACKAPAVKFVRTADPDVLIGEPQALPPPPTPSAGNGNAEGGEAEEPGGSIDEPQSHKVLEIFENYIRGIIRYLQIDIDEEFDTVLRETLMKATRNVICDDSRLTDASILKTPWTLIQRISTLLPDEHRHCMYLSLDSEFQIDTESISKYGWKIFGYQFVLRVIHSALQAWHQQSKEKDREIMWITPEKFKLVDHTEVMENKGEFHKLLFTWPTIKKQRTAKKKSQKRSASRKQQEEYAEEQQEEEEYHEPQLEDEEKPAKKQKTAKKKDREPVQSPSSEEESGSGSEESSSSEEEEEAESSEDDEESVDLDDAQEKDHTLVAENTAPLPSPDEEQDKPQETEPKQTPKKRGRRTKMQELAELQAAAENGTPSSRLRARRPGQ